MHPRRLILALVAALTLLAVIPAATATPRTIAPSVNRPGLFSINYSADTTKVAAWCQQPSTVLLVAKDPAMLAAVHARSRVAATAYSDAFNVPTYTTDYPTLVKAESTFLHTADPAFTNCLPCETGGCTSDTVTWAKDGRHRQQNVDANNEYSFSGSGVTLSGYTLFRRQITDGVASHASWVQVSASIASTAVSYTDTGLNAGGIYQYLLRSRLSDGTTVAYSDTTTRVALGSTSHNPYFIGSGTAYSVDWTQWCTDGSGDVVVGVTVKDQDGLGALDLCMDLNGDRTINTSNEVFAMTSQPATRQYTLSKTIAAATITANAPANAGGATGTNPLKPPIGVSWYVKLHSGSTRWPVDTTQVFTTNINNRVVDASYHNYAVNPSDSTWCRLKRNEAATYASQGFDGIMVDDCDTTLTGYMGVKPPLAYRSGVTWGAQLDTVLTHYRAGFGAGLIMPNAGTTRRPGYLTTATANAMLWEHWLASTSVADSFASHASFVPWGTQMQGVLDYQAANPNAPLALQADMSDTTKVVPYVLANYLLVKNPSTYLCISGPNLGLNIWPLQTLWLGSPAQARPTSMGQLHRSSGLWGRRYANGLVLVNPSADSTKTETFTVPLYKLTLNNKGQATALGGHGSVTATKVSSVTLGPKSSAILMTTANWQGGTRQRRPR